MTPPNKNAIAAEVWRALFDFIVATAGHRNEVLKGLELTPNDSRALTGLDDTVGRTMRSLAEEWRCDASTATWIVDRLEKRGLVKRRSDPEDRRVTRVVLSPRGVKTRQRLVEGVYKPPTELLTLESRDLAALRDALAKLPRSGTRAIVEEPTETRVR